MLFAGIIGLLAGIIYAMVPSYSCKIVETRAVDVFAALEVKKGGIGAIGMMKTKLGKDLLGPESTDVLIPTFEYVCPNSLLEPTLSVHELPLTVGAFKKCQRSSLA